MDIINDCLVHFRYYRASLCASADFAAARCLSVSHTPVLCL